MKILVYLMLYLFAFSCFGMAVWLGYESYHAPTKDSSNGLSVACVLITILGIGTFFSTSASILEETDDA